MALPKIDIPKYTVTLPSTKKPVEFRPFLVKEEKMLLLTQETKDEKMLASALRDVIKSCTFGKIDANALTPYDVEYLFLQIRGKSVGEKISLQVKCEECDHTIPMDVMVDDIKKNDSWDGASQAFYEIVKKYSLNYRLVGKKCGIIQF